MGCRGGVFSRASFGPRGDSDDPDDSAGRRGAADEGVAVGVPGRPAAAAGKAGGSRLGRAERKRGPVGTGALVRRWSNGFSGQIIVNKQADQIVVFAQGDGEDESEQEEMVG